MPSFQFRFNQLAIVLVLWTGALPVEAADAAMALTLTSPAFKPGAPIPSLYTCEGKEVSPPLAWQSAPEGTKSLALIVDDPDAPDPRAPKRVGVIGWLYTIPPEGGRLAENAEKGGLRGGRMGGAADWGKAAYGGPCPPIGRHRYFHKLYALDTTLDLA